MSRAVVLIDGEHYPPVVRFALEALGRECEVVSAVFVGGTEKIEPVITDDEYGVAIVGGGTPAEALARALELTGADEVVDLSDEPVLTSADRFRLASVALEHGASYRGADFVFTAPRERATTQTPTLAVIGTGKRVGKTAISAHIARTLAEAGMDVAVIAMGRGGPAEPELIHGETVRLNTVDLLALAHRGVHAASDSYEDAVMARVTTIGCRRCGGGMAGETLFSNVPEGSLLADSLGKELLLLEGSGAAIPPVHADAVILVVGADRGEAYVRDYFGPYRLSQADLVVLVCGEETLVEASAPERFRDLITEMRPGLPVVTITLRPVPLESVTGRRVFFATTAPFEVLGRLVEYLEEQHGCKVVAKSPYLSNRTRLRTDLEAAAGTFDLLLTELKAAAIDVIAEAGDYLGIQTVLCDNVPVATDESDFEAVVRRIAELAVDRGRRREEESRG